MKVFRSILLLFLVLFSVRSFAIESPEGAITPTVRTIYSHILDLELEKAQRQINLLKVQTPDNPMVYLLENYIDFLTLFIGEDTRDYDRLLPNKDRRIRAIRMTSKNSAYYRFTEAHIRLQWALVMIKMEHRVKAFKEISDAYFLLKKNREDFPEFLPNKMTYGFIRAILGAMPKDVRWWVSWIGIEGNINRGLEEVKSIVKASGEERMFLPEAMGMLSFIYINFKNAPSQAYNYIHSPEFARVDGRLAEFARAHVFIKRHDASGALVILNSISKSGTDLSFPYLDFMKGMAYMQSLNPKAEKHFNHFIQTFKGRHYLKEAYQKLAWCDVLFHQGKQYDRYMADCQRVGVAVTDADKAALEEAKSKVKPNKYLLQARVLLDGGYYDQSLDILEQITALFQVFPHRTMVVNYLKARNYEQKQNWFHAIRFYKEVVKAVAYDTDYRLCNAAYHLGVIYARLGNVKLAKYYYHMALGRSPDRYELSIHSKATAGLNLLESKS